MLHTHELFLRCRTADGGIELRALSSDKRTEDEAVDSLINTLEDIAKKTASLNDLVDGFIYKVDGKTEFFVSRYYYLWPNYTDREDHKK